MESSRTENGALGYSTTNNKCLDFFILPTRNYDKDNLIRLFDEAFNENPFRALQILFHLRDPRNGKGEKELTKVLLIHMSDNYPKNFSSNLRTLTEEFGCYKMLCELYASDYQKQSHKASLLPLCILGDAISQGNPLAAKWAPSEHGFYNHKKQGYQVTKICKILGLVRINNNGQERPNLDAYRKLITPLRTKANIVEQLCCANKWNDIDFTKVTSKAMLILSKKAFPSHCEDKFNSWKEAVKEGKKEVKIAGLQPHEIIRSAIELHGLSDTQELQWNTMVEKLRKLGTLNNALAMVDVSGSMYTEISPRPIDVSLALGLLISEVAQGKFNKKILTFSTDPKIMEVEGNTLYTKINSICSDGMGFSTNYVKALRSILEYGKLFQIPQDMMPTSIFVLTDMEFNQADPNGSQTPHEVVKQEYEKAGYYLPKIIFWNIACRSNTMPVEQKDENTAIISGFSSMLLKAFLKLDPKDAFNPLVIMESILENYKPLVCNERS